MKLFSEALLSDLESALKTVLSETELPLHYSERAIKITIPALEQLKSRILQHEFDSKAAEIDFFKNMKPRFIYQLIYYNEIYTIESNKPQGGEKALRNYYKGELRKLKAFFDENVDFYKYYRTGSCHLDKKYFLRGRYDIKLTLDSSYFQADNRFSSSHDFKVAKIMANDLLQVYLEKEISKLNNRSALAAIKKQRILKWTGPKTALIELTYALHAEGVFNNGRTDLKETAKFFEELFDIDLGQFHRTFFEMRARKSERTKFLNSLRETLVRRMDEVDEP